MNVKRLHNWRLSYARAGAIQSALAEKVEFCSFKGMPHLVAGLDCAFSKDGKRICAAAIVLKFGTFEPVETSTAVAKASFPYIPGLLSFREAPVCIKAARKLKISPDIFLIDGQGIAHPRRLGIASHLGIVFDWPTIGCAKSRLTGSFDDVGFQKGDYSLLKDGSETIGAVLRTRNNVKPLFVSVGNKCLLKDAVRITLACAVKYRLPEPTRLAHQRVSKLRLEI
ncbi:MAG TPA: deoxyribonuclease V [Planctomycetes bacterium]|nr:deoxyribonuclease V [Planctomycetota bacterium]HIJ71236.1 deoxyribonuclease V [Planctomycetota bacterium]